MRKAYLVVAIALALAVVAQFYFAAFGVFGSHGNEDAGMFAGHSLLGTVVIPVLSLLAFVVALIARAGGKTVGLSILPLGLVVVQILLFILTEAVTGATPERSNTPAAIILGLHAINGLAILAVALYLVWRARTLVKYGAPVHKAKLDRAAPVAA